MVAKIGRSCDAAAEEMITTPQGPGPEAASMITEAAPARVRPFIRGVIVLTVKLFGETLEAPRTLTV
ncbi:hypothetical protein [Streptomyces clavuligerus]|uniref:Uncharacterized protein n=1 Tax=Streptomyces clavuligerus TaxID=1901 RepID=B5H038_STRCL|nr:hypothetical protein [Streptomyces clavuligerus]AXU12409.1 hypothetical protein D1794_06515 [Streptomyces clavuligerus]EDY51934.1 hypothetical protein SSCG_04962 [Streptomyces clavuligerus]EFG09597.1 Hypothetical protein SCLAV_4526 [Streptomyces clavuligerus]MBY6302297.1 hypothetical protein [Streptomyces clavuligerus]QCS05191.1 hypothetical protein CRV15_05935 [Streptomyces clavuligerus]